MAPDQLQVLKNQLLTAMQQIRRRENALAVVAERQSVEPQTIAQIDALTRKLSEALDELRTKRAALEKAQVDKK